MARDADTRLVEFRQRLGGKDQRTLLDYWQAKRGARPMPSRADIDPAELVPLLSNLMLVDVVEGGARFRFRLVGTRVARASGEDRTGRFFDEYAFFRAYPSVTEQYRQVVASGEPMLATEIFFNREHGTAYDVERLLLPLGREEGQTDMLLAHFRFMRGPFSRE
ncbi:MAG TPA: PAS domain-containing protein [Hypericibacter adhaerens]|uniref:PAS domain-containing protein n=1 Tax=Hypericibacter adhaerens TaxID=2602016 RepID=A0A5J6MWB7_9PROT|nr:PAS domain-containing protein [Hypericibacter adhaerens]QEX20995.1 hypothetical protein FRZ61_09150 [Hypericibacter adhaerens]HWA45301.1 PAS domain-containing protein [Hypericibacter adhaerens]